MIAKIFFPYYNVYVIFNHLSVIHWQFLKKELSVKKGMNGTVRDLFTFFATGPQCNQVIRYDTFAVPFLQMKMQNAPLAKT